MSTKNLLSYIQLGSPISKELKEILKNISNPIILDIGACELEDSIRYKNLFPNAVVYAFEPLKKNYEKCILNKNKFSSEIRVFNFALSNKNGFSNFYVSEGQPEGVIDSEWDYGNKSSSLLEPVKSANHSWLKFDKLEKVITKRLDTFCIENNITNIDFIHLDVQGAELLVLRGAGKMLNQTKSIWLEVSQKEFYKGQPLKINVEKFLFSHGFTKIRDTNEEMGDQLYINTKFFPTTHNVFIQKKNNNIFREIISFFKNKIRKVTKKNNKLLHDLKIQKISDFSFLIPKDREWAFTTDGYYEKNVEFWLKEVSSKYSSKKNTCFIDIGANIGYYSIILSKYYEKILAFEPAASSIDVFNRNVEINKAFNISLFTDALSDNTGIDIINLYENSGQNSIIRRKQENDEEINTIGTQTVKLTTLDKKAKDIQINGARLIKIDVEDFELKVLKGAENVIRTFNPFLVFEFSMNTSRDAGYKKEDILDLNFLQNNYKYFGLSENYNDTKLHTVLDASIANIIAVPNNLVKEFTLHFNQLIVA